MKHWILSIEKSQIISTMIPIEGMDKKKDRHSGRSNVVYRSAFTLLQNHHIQDSAS